MNFETRYYVSICCCFFLEKNIINKTLIDFCFLNSYLLYSKYYFFFMLFLVSIFWNDFDSTIIELLNKMIKRPKRNKKKN